MRGGAREWTRKGQTQEYPGVPRGRSPKPAHERFSQHQQPGGVRSGKRWNVVQGRKEDQRGVGKDGERSPKVPTRPEESPSERTKCRPRDDTQAEQPQEGGEGRNARQRKPGQQGGVETGSRGQANGQEESGTGEGHPRGTTTKPTRNKGGEPGPPPTRKRKNKNFPARVLERSESSFTRKVHG